MATDAGMRALMNGDGETIRTVMARTMPMTTACPWAWPVFGNVNANDGDGGNDQDETGTDMGRANGGSRLITGGASSSMGRARIRNELHG